MFTQLMLRIITAIFASSLLCAGALQVDDFPQIDQRIIAGAENRCGAVAAGSWLLWFAENGYPELVASQTPATGTPFETAPLPVNYCATLSDVDRLCGGKGEIRLYTLSGAMIEYIHQLEEMPIEVVLYNYKLPDEALLRELLASGAATVLLHGIYRKDPATGLLQRVTGHYSCLIGANESALVANTYAQPYQFTLGEIPMQMLHANDRYRPTGIESLIALKYPSDKYPNHTFRSFAPKDASRAQEQTILSGPTFAESDEFILLEAAIGLWIQRKNPRENAEN